MTEVILYVVVGVIVSTVINVWWELDPAVEPSDALMLISMGLFWPVILAIGILYGLFAGIPMLIRYIPRLIEKIKESKTVRIARAKTLHK